MKRDRGIFFCHRRCPRWQGSICGWIFKLKCPKKIGPRANASVGRRQGFHDLRTSKNSKLDRRSNLTKFQSLDAFARKIILGVFFNGWDLECRSNEQRQSLSLSYSAAERGGEGGRTTISRVTSTTTTSLAHRRPNRGNTPTLSLPYDVLQSLKYQDIMIFEALIRFIKFSLPCLVVYWEYFSSTVFGRQV